MFEESATDVLEVARANEARLGPPREREVSLGTTIMAVEFKDGVVLGADTRTSMGTYISNRVAKKLTRLADSIYCCRSGSAADTQAIADIVSARVEEWALRYNVRPTVRDTAVMAKNIVYNNEGLLAGLIIAGYDHEGPAVYSIPLGGSLIRQKYATGGSGSIYIAGLCDSLFHENMTKEEAVQFATRAITHAMSRDNSSGGCVRLLVITRDGEEEVFVPGDTLLLPVQ